MKHLRLTHVLAAVAVISALAIRLGVETGTLAAIAVALFCPLMMVACVGHMARHGHHAGRVREPSDTAV